MAGRRSESINLLFIKLSLKKTNNNYFDFLTFQVVNINWIMDYK